MGALVAGAGVAAGLAAGAGSAGTAAGEFGAAAAGLGAGVAAVDAVDVAGGGTMSAVRAGMALPTPLDCWAPACRERRLNQPKKRDTAMSASLSDQPVTRFSPFRTPILVSRGSRR
jgi:hypothetical protein